MDSSSSLKRKKSDSFDSLKNETTVTKKSKIDVGSAQSLSLHTTECRKVKFGKLYRLLREDERVSEGLKPKKPNATRSVVEHVASGSKGWPSKYISTCSTLSSVKSLLNLKLRSRRHSVGTKQIAEIDVKKLPNDVRIIDLTEQKLREQHESNEGSSLIHKFHKHAAEFDEVLLEGTVPSHCLRLLKYK